MSKQIIQLLPILIVLLMQGCVSNGEQWNPNDYVVKSGDTVYSIAWHYELNPIEFARWNNIDSAHFLIHPGQRLRIHKPAGFGTQRVSTGKIAVDSASKMPVAQLVSRHLLVAKPLTQIKIKAGDTLYGVSKKYAISLSRLVQLNQLKQPYVLQPGQILLVKPVAGMSLENRSSKTQSKHLSGRRHSRLTHQLTRKWAKTIHWQWPVRGRVLTHFMRNRHDAKGIDIGGNMGSRINAAADGKVVYSGNGLISYGDLVIIKHNKHYLSAYAYNRKLLVHEGQWVKAGQKIAEMGRNGSSSPRLHFEIRRNGKPMNPQKYLP